MANTQTTRRRDQAKNLLARLSAAVERLDEPTHLKAIHEDADLLHLFEHDHRRFMEVVEKVLRGEFPPADESE